MSGRILHAWAALPRSGGAVTSGTVSFADQYDRARRYRIVRVGWLTTTESTLITSPTQGDQVALFRLRVGSMVTKGLVAGLYYPLARNDELPRSWDGKVVILGGDGTNSWSPDVTPDPLGWVEIEEGRPWAEEPDAAGACR